MGLYVISVNLMVIIIDNWVCSRPSLIVEKSDQGLVGSDPKGLNSPGEYLFISLFSKRRWGVFIMG